MGRTVTRGIQSRVRMSLFARTVINDSLFTVLCLCRHRRGVWESHWTVVVVGLAAVAVYSNSLSGGFVFDDNAAVARNLDVRPETPLWNLWGNDFW